MNGLLVFNAMFFIVLGFLIPGVAMFSGSIGMSNPIHYFEMLGSIFYINFGMILVIFGILTKTTIHDDGTIEKTFDFSWSFGTDKK